MAILTFDVDGTVEFTRKPQITALFPDQQRDEKRMSEIVFDNVTQLYSIEMLKGLFAGCPVCLDILYAVKPGTLWLFPIEPALIFGDSGILYFNTYEDAVLNEVYIIDEMRRRGLNFHE